MHSYQQKVSRKMVGRVDGVPGVSEEAVKRGEGNGGRGGGVMRREGGGV